MNKEIEPSETGALNSLDSANDNEECKKCGFKCEHNPSSHASSPEEQKIDTPIDAISNLLQTPFSSRSEDEQRHIIICWTQPLKHDELNKEVDHKWLCSSSKLQKLFCWPCLLLSTEKNTWCESGFDDYLNITESASAHEDSKGHIGNLLQFVELKYDFNDYCKDETTSNDGEEEKRKSAKIAKYDENVEQNRRLMQIIIDTVLCAVAQETLESKGVFKCLFELVMKFGPEDIMSHYEKVKPIFLDNTRAMQDELVQCINEYIQDYIKKELQATDMFAVRLDSNDYAIMVRFIKVDGHLVERFLGFHTPDLPATWGIFHMLDTALEPFDYKNKLVAQSYDSGYLTSSHLDEIQKKIKEEASQAVFVYCIEHRLNLLLEQHFVGTFPSFFFINFRAIYKLKLQRHLPEWPSDTTNMFKVVVENWDSLCSCLENYVQNRYEYDIYNFYEAMREFEFAYLTCLFAEIFEATNPLYDVLKQQSLNINACLEQIQNTCKTIKGIKREENCQRLFESAKTKTEDDEQDYNKYKKMFDDILDNILFKLYVRFQDMSKLHFVGLTDSSKFEEYVVNFPTHLLTSLKECFPKMFPKIERLKHELEVFYGEEIYYNEGVENVISILRVCDIHKHVLTEVYRLFCLVATLPSTYVEETFSFLQGVKTCIRHPYVDDIYRNKYSAEHIGIQKKIIDDLTEEEKDVFYNRIIDRFAALGERAIDLM